MSTALKAQGSWNIAPRADRAEDGWTREIPCVVCGGMLERFYRIDASSYLKGVHESAQQLEFWLSRCGACAHLQVDPMPTPALLQRIYQEYLDDAREGFYSQHWMDDPVDTPALRRLVPRLAEIRRRLPGHARLCEVGCATGSFLLLARAQGFDCVGVELGRGAAEFGRTRRGLDIRAGTLEEADLPQASVDVLVMWDLIEHVPDPVSLLRAARRIVRPGGLLVLETPDAASLVHRVARGVHLASLGRLRTGMSWIYNIHHCHCFSPRTLARVLSLQGFHLDEVSQDRTLLEAFADAGGRSLRGRALVLAVRAAFVLARVLRQENKLVAFASREN